MVYLSLMKVSEVVEGVLLVTTNVAGSPNLILWGLIQGFCLHFKVCAEPLSVFLSKYRFLLRTAYMKEYTFYLNQR